MNKILPLFLVLAACGWAQQMAPPAPELKKLDAFVGTWKTEGQLKAGPGSNGGTFSSVDKYEWQKGGYWLVGHANVSGMGLPDGAELNVLGYDSNRAEYTYDSFSSMGGRHEAGVGKVDGDTWTWSSAEGSQFRWRFTEKIVSPTSLTMKYEISTDGANWIEVLEAKSTKLSER